MDEDVSWTKVGKVFFENEDGGFLAGRHLIENGAQSFGLCPRAGRSDERR
jgi:hypothetical protein